MPPMLAVPVITPFSTDAGDAQQYKPYPNVDLPPFLRQTKSEIGQKFLDLEWQQLRNSESISEWRQMNKEHVLVRNRYDNVDPYRHNRIRLKVPDGQCDYINASPITLSSSITGAATKYIATQGPVERSCSHFWRMVWNESPSPSVIVMLTQTHESGREKCYPYYPLSLEIPTMLLNDNDEFGDGLAWTLNLVSIRQDAVTKCTVRELELSTTCSRKGRGIQLNNDVECNMKNGANFDEQPYTKLPEPKPNPSTLEEAQPRKIYHFLFGGWPDFYVPEGDNRNALLSLIALSRTLNQGKSPPFFSDQSPYSDYDGVLKCATSFPSTGPNPRIVHCSAGVGRSGTFIALDHLLSELREGSWDDLVNSGDDYDPIAETVHQLRNQRTMMVQACSQFEFIYDVVRRCWQERWMRKTGHSILNSTSSERKEAVLEGRNDRGCRKYELAKDGQGGISWS